MSPSNNPLLNPAALKAGLDTGGSSYVRGARHFAADMAVKPRVPSMVDTTAFNVGQDLAVTPGAVVLRTEVFELIQYTPQTPKVRRVPLIVVPPTINKYYVADLAPGRSMVEHFVQSGQQVFMVSWRNPGKKHAVVGPRHLRAGGARRDGRRWRSITRSHKTHPVLAVRGRDHLRRSPWGTWSPPARRTGSPRSPSASPCSTSPAPG